MRIILGIATGLVGLLFLVLGVEALFSPAQLGSQLAVTATEAAGYATIRADLAALFLVIGACSLVGIRKSTRHWLIVPAALLAIIVLGRIAGLLADGRSAQSRQAFVVEALSLLILLIAWRSAGTLIPGRVTLGFTGLLFLIAASAIIFQRPLGVSLQRRLVENGITHTAIDDLPDALHAGLCGSGAPLPDPNRAGPCVFVLAGRHLYVVDAGEDSPRKLGLMRVPMAQIDAIFLTHFHSDHIGGLGEMMLNRWAGTGHTQPVEVYGPQGVESVVSGFNDAYRLDTGYRVAHHGAATLPPSGAGGVAHPFTIPQSGAWSQVVLSQDGVTVTAFSVNHTPVFPAAGYRFDYQGRSVVISGDTAPSENLVNVAKGADILFHEGLQTTLVNIMHDAAVRHGKRTAAKITGDIPSYHTTPEDAARLAARAGVRQLVFYHIIPGLPFGHMEGAFLGDAAKYYHGPITVGNDGLMATLPPRSTEILMHRLL